MALTKPKIWDLDTNVVFFTDAITVLHQGSTSANIDVGFLFNRANGLVSNVALYWSESANSFVTSFTSNSGVTNGNIVATSYANLTIGGLLTVSGAGITFSEGAGIVVNGSRGSAGQSLIADGVGGVEWASGGFGGGYVANETIFAANLVANSSTTSTNTTTGALVVVGGAGISGAVYAGSLYDNGNRVLTSFSSSGAGNLTVSVSNPTSTTIALPATGPGATTTGSATAIPVITTDAYGRISAISTASVSSTLNIAGTTGTGAVSLTSQTLTVAAGTGITTSASGQTITVSIPQAVATSSTPTFAGLTSTGNVVVGSPAILTGTGTATTINNGAKLLDSFAVSQYRSAKYILSVTDVTNSGYQTNEIILMQDGTYANISSYGLVYSGISEKMTFSSNIINGNVMIWGTGVSANNTIKYVRTLIPV